MTFNMLPITHLEQIEELVEGIYVVNEVIRFSERLLNTALTSSADLSLILKSLSFHLWVIGSFK